MERRFRRSVTLATIALGICLAPPIEGGEDPLPRSLSVARQVGERFKGAKYGSGPGQVNCVTFMLAVIEELTSSTLGPSARSQVLISDVDTRIEDLHDLVEQNDSRIQGVVKVLVDLGRGRRVDVDDVQVGDFLQYWGKTKDRWSSGHAALVHEVDRTAGRLRVKIYGAHKTTDGVAVHPEWINLRSETRRVFVGRFDG